MRPTQIQGETVYNDILAHQAQAEDRILQNWIATQELAKEAPAFQMK